MKLETTARFVARFLELTSYVFTVFEWLWFGILLAPLFKGSEIMKLLLPNGVTQTQPVVEHHSNSPMLLVIAAAVTALMIIISVIVLWKLPKNILKAGEAVSYSVTETVLPLAIHHKKISKKKRAFLTQRIVFFVRLLFIMIPFVGILFCPAIQDIGVEVAWFVGAGLALVAVTSLFVEQVLSHFFTKQKLSKHKK